LVLRRVFFLALFMVGLTCDASERTWALARDGVVVRWGRAAQLVPLPDWQWAERAYACPPVLALGPGGEVIVTSNVVPTLWRVDARTLRVTVHRLELDADHDKDVGFTSLRYSAAEEAWIAFSAGHGSTWRIDRGLARARKIAEHQPAGRAACPIA